MKHYIIALAMLIGCSTLIAKEPITTNSAERLISFIQLECGKNGHKDQWLNNMNSNVSEKITLLKKHHNEWAQFEIKNINELNGKKSFSHIDKENFFNYKLKGAIELHKKQTADWKKLCEKHVLAAHKLADEQKTQLESFEASNQ